MARLGALLAACALAALCSGAVAAPGQRLLVLLDDPAMEQSHSRFLGALKARGYQVDARPIASSALQLKSWDEWLYDKVAILGGAKSEPAGPGCAVGACARRRDRERCRRRRLPPLPAGAA